MFGSTTPAPSGQTLFGSTPNTALQKENNAIQLNSNPTLTTTTATTSTAIEPKKPLFKPGTSRFSILPNGDGPKPGRFSALRDTLSAFVSTSTPTSTSVSSGNSTTNANAEMFNLEESLRVNAEWFGDPLQKKGKDATDRTKVQQQVTNVDALEVLKLSETLCLNEMEALQLWTEAKDPSTQRYLQQQRPLARAGAKSTFETALLLYYAQRGFLFQTISDLMRLRSVDDPAALPVAKQDFILRKTDQILRQYSLIKVLISSIRTLNADISKLLSTTTRVDHLDIHLESLEREREHAAEGVFIYLYHSTATSAEATEVIKCCMELSSRWVLRPQVVKNTRESTASFRVCYLLLLSVACVLEWEHPLYDREITPIAGETVAGGRRLGEDKEWLVNMDRLMLSRKPDMEENRGGFGSGGGNEQGSLNAWHHDGVHGVCLFLWSIFLAKVSTSMNVSGTTLASREHRMDALKLAFDLRAVAFLRGLVNSAEFRMDEFNTLLTTIIDDLCVNYIAISDLDAAATESDDLSASSSEELLLPRTQLLEEARARRSADHQRRKRLQMSNGYTVNPNAMSSGSVLGGGWGVHSIYDGQRGSGSSFSGQEVAVGNSGGRDLGLGGSHMLRTSGGGGGMKRGSSQEDEEAEEPMGDAIEDFLSLIASLCRLHPVLSQKFWRIGDFYGKKYEAVKHSVFSFIPKLQQRVAPSNDPKSLYVSLLDLLAALSCDPTSAHASFTYLKSAQHNAVSWTQMFAALRHYAKGGTTQQYQQLVDNSAMNVNAQDQFVLCVWLKLLESCASNAEVAKEIVVGKDEGSFQGPAESWNVQELLLELLKLNLKPALKAQIVNVLSVLAKNHDVAKAFWDKMEQSQVLRTHAGMAILRSQNVGMPLRQVADVRSELNEKESSMQIYPFTLSFLRLLKTLVENGGDNERYQYLGTNENAGMYSYLEFLTEEVLVKSDQRPFSSAGKMWEMTALVLGIFQHILETYKQDSRCAKSDFEDAADGSFKSYSAGFWLMTQILQGGALFKKVMGLIPRLHGAHGVLLARSGTKPAAKQDLAAFFVTASDRRNLDLEQTKHELPGNRSGYGLMRIRQKAVNSQRVGEDSGRYGAWLVRPSIDGWTETTGNVGGEENKAYVWDDGDADGKWQEASASLALELIVAAARREDWFLNKVSQSSANIDNRLERLHRMLLFRRDWILGIASFVRYPLSAKLRMLSIQIMFRISMLAKRGALVREFMHEDTFVDGVRWCLEQPVPARVEDEAHDTEDLAAEAKIHSCILQLLIESLKQQKGNLAHLLLGFLPAFSVQCVMRRKTSLHVVLDTLDREMSNFNTATNVQVLAQMYELLILLCKAESTREIMTALPKMKNGFWLRHLRLTRDGPLPDKSAAAIHSLASVLEGVSTELRLAQDNRKDELLAGLFGSGAEAVRVVDLLDGVLDESRGRSFAEAPLELKEMVTRGPLLQPFAECNGRVFYMVDVALMLSLSAPTETMNWALEWNESQRICVAVARAIQAWAGVLRTVLINCRSLLGRIGSLRDLAMMVITNIFAKLSRLGASINAAHDPMVELVMELIWELRSAEDQAISTEQSHALISGILACLRQTKRGNYTYGWEGASSKIKKFLYASLIHILHANRRMYATQLGAAPNRPSTMVYERVFLLQTITLAVGSKAIASHTPGPLRALRQRAEETLELLRVSDSGDAFTETLLSDVQDSTNRATKALALGVLTAVLPCEESDRLVSLLQKRGIVRSLVSVGMRAFSGTASEAPLEYNSVMSVLGVMALTRQGASVLVECNILGGVSMHPSVVLCEKRALVQREAKVQRFRLVLPLLRLIDTIFVTLNQRQSPYTGKVYPLRTSHTESEDSGLQYLAKQVLRFLNAQRRMLIAALGAMPVEAEDVEECCLLVRILAMCANAHGNALLVKEFRELAVELDALLFNLVCELSKDENALRGDDKPASLHGNLIKQLVIYCRARNPIADTINLETHLQQSLRNKDTSTGSLHAQDEQQQYCRKTDIQSLMLCLDRVAKQLLRVDMNHPELLFVAEGVLTVLYVKLRQVRVIELAQGRGKSLVQAILAEPMLLPRYSASTPHVQASNVERMEEVLKTKSTLRQKKSSAFVHVMIRRLRDLM